MIRFRATALGLLAAAGFGVSANAAPIQISYDAIIPATTEDFQSFSISDITSPASFNGFTFTDPGSPNIANEVCAGGADDLCLHATDDTLVVFSGFSTIAFGFDVGVDDFAGSPSYDVTVVGNSGTSEFTFVGDAQLGFFDPLGLLSVSVFAASQGGSGGVVLPNPGIGDSPDLAFDDVITSSAVASLPLPGGAWLMLAGLAPLWRLRRRRG